MDLGFSQEEIGRFFSRVVGFSRFQKNEFLVEQIDFSELSQIFVRTPLKKQAKKHFHGLFGKL